MIWIILWYITSPNERQSRSQHRGAPKNLINKKNKYITLHLITLFRHMFKCSSCMNIYKKTDKIRHDIPSETNVLKRRVMSTIKCLDETVNISDKRQCVPV